MVNPNGKSGIGWADAITNFGAFLWPVESGDVPILPGHNTSYEREWLLEQDEGAGRLEDIVQVEVSWHLELAAEGESLWLESGAIVDHYNLIDPRAFIEHKFLGGLIFGAVRARGWGLAKRLIRGAMSVVVPPLRLWRTRGRIRQLNAAHGLPLTTYPWMILALLLHGAGEGIGTVFGEFGARRKYWRAEFHRKGAPGPRG